MASIMIVDSGHMYGLPTLPLFIRFSSPAASVSMVMHSCLPTPMYRSSFCLWVMCSRYFAMPS